MNTTKFVPKELLNMQNWVLWKKVQYPQDKKPRKIPFRIDGQPASTTNPSDWNSSDKIKTKLTYSKEDYEGIGFVLPLDNTITFIDLDNCFIDGKITRFAQEILDMFKNTYAEISQSGKGIHIICKAKLPVKDNQVACVKKEEIEIYSQKRYCCMTFNAINAMELADCQENVNKLFNKYYTEKIIKQDYNPQTTTLFVADILDIIQHSKNAEKFNYLYNSAEPNSENTLALCMILAFYCQNDANKIKEIIRMSAMWRDKCNSRRGNTTWLDKEIETAIRNTVQTFSPQNDIKIDDKKIKEIADVEYSKMFLKMSDIKIISDENIKYIKSDFQRIDNSIMGFAMGEVSVWSGLNGSGKSNFLQQQIVEYATQKTKVMLFSGEMTENSIQNMFYKIIAGKKALNKSEKAEFWYLADTRKQQLINFWLDKYLLLYKNDYSMSAKEVINAIRYATKKGVEMVIIDNLMTLDLREYDKDKYEAQSMFAKELARLSKELNIHIHIVMHPRKAGGFLRKDDISGSADLSNAVDNVFIIHRVNADFKHRVLEVYDNTTCNKLNGYDNVIEICKNRRFGIQDFFVGLYFEIESRRFIADRNEDKKYMLGIGD